MQMPGNPLFVNNAFFLSKCVATQGCYGNAQTGQSASQRREHQKINKSVKVEYSTLTVLRQSRIFYFDAKASKYNILL